GLGHREATDLGAVLPPSEGDRATAGPHAASVAHRSAAPRPRFAARRPRIVPGPQPTAYRACVRTLAVVSILFAAACGPSSSSGPAAPTGGAPSAAAAPARPAFEPTSFGVEVAGTGRPVILI